MKITDRNRFMNQFLEKVTSENVCEAAEDIPGEIGEVLLAKKQFQKGVIYLDWSMSFTDRLDVKRKGTFGRDEIQMIFNINHDIEWRIEDRNQTVRMKKGEVCIYRNLDETTSMCYPAQRTFLFKSLQIPTAYFRELLLLYFPGNQIEQLEQLFLHQFTKTKITPAMHQILHDISQAERFGEFKALYLEGKMIELLSVVLHCISHEKTEKIERHRLSEEDYKCVRRIKAQIDEEPAKEYGNEILAKSVNMSVAKLAKCFSQVYGMPLHTYVIRRRLEYAALLLAEQKCNVSEAAAMAGYTNLSHFSNSFRKQYGVLPKDYGR